MKILPVAFVFVCFSLSTFAFAQQTEERGFVCDACVKADELCFGELQRGNILSAIPLELEKIQGGHASTTVSRNKHGVRRFMYAEQPWNQLLLRCVDGKPTSLEVKLGFICKGRVVSVVDAGGVAAYSPPRGRYKFKPPGNHRICFGELLSVPDFIVEEVEASVAQRLDKIVERVSEAAVKEELKGSLGSVLAEREDELVQRVTQKVLEAMKGEPSKPDQQKTGGATK